MRTVLETERLWLRELTADDADALAAIFTDAETMQYYPKVFSMDEVRGWIEWNRKSYQENGFGLWAVVRKDDGRCIGDCGITLQDIEGVRLPEIGYHIAKAFQRMGFASEAARACLQYGFNILKLKSLVSYMDVRNVPSRKTAEKMGMTFVREFRKITYGKNVLDALYRIEK